MSAYQWKVPGLYQVSADTAAGEINRLYKQTGRIEPQDIVDASRPDDAPLHGCFEWDDTKAAELYRCTQAGKLIRCIVEVPDDKEDEPIRAFVNVQSSYQPISVVVKDSEKMDALLDCALKDLESFRRKYARLKELQPVFDAIEEINNR